ncbi:MAG: hypothetical protein CM1200mP3_05600 [Chloroflexota bacterium]|nr:MAG: hypothetical protein CM1200mP3_05600 [Chloroflexota bacterium]
MSLSAQDIAFFDVFGYLILPNFLIKRKLELSNDFEKIALADREGKILKEKNAKICSH